ncbi:antitoxin VbhA family protein (plasmid) [Pseudonocardia alni]|nr:antitoxin VbhA family protein [Pseudonocardia alni]
MPSRDRGDGRREPADSSVRSSAARTTPPGAVGAPASVRAEGLEPSAEGLALLDGVAAGSVSTGEARERVLAQLGHRQRGLGRAARDAAGGRYRR